MHEADGGAGSTASGRSFLVRWGGVVLALGLVVVLAACQSVPPPEPTPAADPEFDLEFELAHLDLGVNEELRVRVLPPLARRMPQGDFVAGLDLEVRTFNVDPATGQASGASLGRTLATTERTVFARGEVYGTLWTAYPLRRLGRAADYLRLEIRTPGGPDAPVCNDHSEACLGYLDVYLFQGRWRGLRAVPDGFVPLPARAAVLPLAFKVLARAPGGDPAPATIDELVGVSGAALSGGAGNCASSFLTRPGQGLQAVGAGLQAVGAVGGLFQGATGSFPPSLVTPAAVGGELVGQLPDDFFGSIDTVLLVVDDFGAGIQLPPGLFEAGADLDALAPGISHGALVLHHLLQLATTALPEASLPPVTGAGPGGQPYFEFGSGYARLFIQVVDVGEMNTDDIPGEIRAAIEAYGGEGGIGAYTMFVNMSFAVVPCSVLQDYHNATQLETFDEYVGALAAVNGIGDQYAGDLDRLVSTPVAVADDALLRYLACPLPGTSDGVPVCDGSGPTSDDHGPVDRLVHVAASGNYGNDYALYPAASPFVVSVGSLERAGSGYAASTYSNLAEVVAPGGLFELTSGAGRTVAYAGTSFAAPVVTLFLAIDGMDTSSRCFMSGRDPSEPPDLATGTYDMTPFYSTDPSDMDTAVELYCIRPG